MNQQITPLKQSTVSHIKKCLETRGVTKDLQRCMGRDSRKRDLVHLLLTQWKLGKPLNEEPIKQDGAGVSENAFIEAELKTFAKKNTIGFPPKLEAKMFMSVFNFIDTTQDQDMREIGLRYLETIMSGVLWNRSDFQCDINVLTQMVDGGHGTDRQKYAAARIITAWHVKIGDPREQDWELHMILKNNDDQVVLGALNCLASISFDLDEVVNSMQIIEQLAEYCQEQKIRKAAEQVLWQKSRIEQKLAKKYMRAFAFEESSGTEKTAAVPPYESRRKESSQDTDGGYYRYVP